MAPAAPEPSQPLPAGVAPQDVAPTRPSFRDRGRLRRRLRYLRRVRELGLRDLGGLVFDLHRFGRQGDDLVRGKLAGLDVVDRELRALERVLDERRDIIELREPGIAACPRCGALHGSDARFCPACGTPVHGPLALGGVLESPPAGAATGTGPLAHPAAGDGPTPVTAALADPAPAGGDPPAPAPGADGPARNGADQPTATMPAASAEGTADAPAVPGGDPPAPRERPAP